MTFTSLNRVTRVHFLIMFSFPFLSLIFFSLFRSCLVFVQFTVYSIRCTFIRPFLLWSFLHQSHPKNCINRSIMQQRILPPTHGVPSRFQLLRVPLVCIDHLRKSSCDPLPSFFLRPSSCRNTSLQNMRSLHLLGANGAQGRECVPSRIHAYILLCAVCSMMSGVAYT